VVVISSNVDDLEGAAGNARQAFVGQGFEPAGYGLARAQWANMPAEGPIHVLVGVSGPGQNWSETRALGVTNFLDEQIKANPDRAITYEKIDSGLDLAIVADRVGAYLSAHPETNAYFDTGFWHAGVAGVLRDRGIEPGKVLLGGFDLVPIVLDEMDSGYIQVEVDQQPYEQGFMPVMMVYLSKTVGLSPVDINTGEALVYPKDVAAVRELSEKGLR
jgi:simple sugar transport system substrate-binding protein